MPETYRSSLPGERRSAIRDVTTLDIDSRSSATEYWRHRLLSLSHLRSGLVRRARIWPRVVSGGRGLVGEAHTQGKSRVRHRPLRQGRHAGRCGAAGARTVRARAVVACASVRNVPWRYSDGQVERLTAGHEDVLVAVVVERFAGESAIESFQPQARDVEESQPFVLGCPPERTGSTTVQGDVDPVIADAVVDRVRQRCVGVLAVYGGCDLMVEGERVPGEATVRPKRCGDRLKAAATIGPRGQMQQRPAGAVDHRRRFLDLN